MNEIRLFVNQLVPGQTLDQIFLVRDKDLRTTKTGDLFILCTLADKTGTVPARMWQASQAIFNSIAIDGFLHVKGRTEDYRGSLQFIIDACRPVPSEKVEIADYLPVTTGDIEEMWSELLEILRGVRDKHLRLLIKKFVEDKEFVAAFKRAPAAVQLHHPFIGGLLEHTLNVARLVRVVLPLYPQLNADLLLAGAFFHDCGKTAELSAGTSINYTECGQLVGHINLAAVWLARRAEEVSQDSPEPFPPRLLSLLQHLVLSHHGEHEYGSPKLPAIPEAFVLHYLDNLDAKVFMTLRDIQNDPDPKNAFTQYNRALETRLFKFSTEPPAAPAETPPKPRKGGLD
ncbi:MAG: 3'-5' exoribonuclease YhaM [Planctomycetes bacterium ADurb.Bin126]|nr:MAG: 3'-5' exoribonuclease YhaM [Planctomycetes bacterium ADurb.Bin126]HOD81671.1 HD domain-containing protein [Phycisphaerae bacterium]HQL76153.1 HD domain-containing protein [Phycisphaerae bacterium]